MNISEFNNQLEESIQQNQRDRFFDQKYNAQKKIEKDFNKTELDAARKIVESSLFADYDLKLSIEETANIIVNNLDTNPWVEFNGSYVDFLKKYNNIDLCDKSNYNDCFPDVFEKITGIDFENSEYSDEEDYEGEDDEN